MAEEGEGHSPRGAASSAQAGHTVDGGIDFSAYTVLQLRELQYTIDPQVFPQNFRNLLAELERREQSAGAPPPVPGTVAGRFTRADGLHGWLQAKLTRSPVYGPGSIEVQPSQVLLRGWQRTWLGAPVQAEIVLPVGSIRHVRRDGVRVELTCKSRYRRVRQVEFEATDSASALRLVDALHGSPAVTPDQRWAGVSDFYGQLRTLCPHVWVTPALVLVNVAIYIAMVVTARRLGGFDPQLLLSWGADYGPLTVNGQWWRLIAALFVHLNLLHLLLNMWALWNIGRLTERLFGRWVFFCLYFAAGGLASLSSIAWDPTRSSAGASGAIFGILGAFLAFLIRRREDVPRTIIRAHWISTAAFVLFNLVSGALQTGIDNAAHVGGLVSGLVLGYVLAPPLAYQRRRFSLPQTTAAVGVVAAALLAALWQIRGIGAQLTGPEQFYRTHGWYVSGEGKNLLLWQELAQQAASGTISDAALGQRFQQEILPFWQSASERLQKETQTAQGSQRSVVLLGAEFARDRLNWAQAVIDAATKSDSGRASDAQTLAEQTDAVQARLDRMWLLAAMAHRPRALANSALVVRLRELLSLDRWKCVERPVYFGAPISPRDARNDAPAQRQTIACQAQRLFMNGDYASLDTLMTESARHQSDLADGSSTYGAVARGLSNLFAYGGLDIAAALGRVSDWHRAVRDPLEADVVQAMLFDEWAWTARGGGYASGVSAQAFAVFRHRVEMAAAALSDTGARAKSSPLWYQLSLEVGLDQSIGADRLRAIFDQGVAVFPDYLPLHAQLLRSLMPRWGGSYDAVDRFIVGVARTQGRRGSEFYTRLYWIYASLEGDDVDIFAESGVEWPRMKAGFEDLTQRYPHSDYLLNAYANFACRAGDKDRYQALRSRLKARESASVWSNRFSLQSCDKRFVPAVAGMASVNRNQGESPAPAATPGSTLRAYGGVTLGMDPEELVKARGAPAKRVNSSHWIYDSIDSAHDGLLDVYFDNSAGGSSNKVRAVLFWGKESAAPPGLPNLTGLTRRELIRRFGDPTYTSDVAPDTGYVGFRNGIIALVRSDSTISYGVYVTP